MRLGEYLLQQGIINEEQLEIALKQQEITGEKLGEILIRLNFVKRQHILNALCVICPEALIGENFSSFDIPLDILLDTKTVVLGDTGQTLYVATLHDSPMEAKQIVEQYARGKIVQLVSYPANLLYQKYLEMKNVKVYDIDYRVKSLLEREETILATNELFLDALNSRASDIHIEPQEKVVIIRYRIDGVLYIKMYLPIEIHSLLVTAIKNRAGMDVSETRLPQDGSFSYSYCGRLINLRVATLPSANGEKVSIRLLDREKMLLDINELGLTKINDWLEISSQQTGLVLVCGPTGSGKTTTLYATVQWLDRIHKTVYSIEDPIEYHLPFINQVQINRKAGFDFAMYLKTIVRHDPDVIIVGEIRDRETAVNALTLSDTGHLVFSTLHTNDIPSTLIRLQGLGVDMTALSFLLKGILVQRLVRKICKNCFGVGCSFCSGIGYMGRTMISEIVRFNSYKEVIALMEGKLPYYTMYEDAVYKVSQGITNKEEIKRVLGIELLNFAESIGHAN